MGFWPQTFPPAREDFPPRPVRPGRGVLRLPCVCSGSTGTPRGVAPDAVCAVGELRPRTLIDTADRRRPASASSPHVAQAEPYSDTSRGRGARVSCHSSIARRSCCLAHVDAFKCSCRAIRSSAAFSPSDRRIWSTRSRAGCSYSSAVMRAPPPRRRCAWLPLRVGDPHEARRTRAGSKLREHCCSGAGGEVDPPLTGELPPPTTAPSSHRLMRPGGPANPESAEKAVIGIRRSLSFQFHVTARVCPAF